MKRGQHAIYGLYLPDEPTVILYAGSWRVATLDERLRQHRRGECRTTAKMAARGSIDTGNLRMRVLAYWMSGVDPNPENEEVSGLQAQGWCRWNHPYAFSSDDSRRGGRIGMKRMNETWGKTPEAQEARERGGRLGGPIGARNQPREAKIRGARNQPREGKVLGGLASAESGWHQSPEGQVAHSRGGCNGSHEDKVRAGRIGSREDKALSGRIGGCNGSHENKVRASCIGNCTRWHSDRPKINRLCAKCAAKGTRTVPVSLA